MVHRLPIGLFLFWGSFLFFWLFSGWGPVTDPVESNYALPAKEMLLGGDWLTPHIYGQIWFDKPILIYWLTALSYQLFGFSDSVSRLVPALAGAGGITLIYSFVARIVSRRHGLVAAMILATSVHYYSMSKALITDMLLFVAGSAGLAYFYMGYSRYKGSTRWYLWMYPCFALAVLAKGPVGVLIPGLVVFLFLLVEKNWRELLKMRLLMGIPFFLLIAVPWFYYMYHLHGMEFLTVLLGVHNFLRATTAEHPGNNFFLFYPAIFLIGFLPWIGFVINGIWKGSIDAWKQKAPFQRFLLLWLFSFFLFYSLMATKYPTYLFPMWFPGAILTALYLPWAPKNFRFAEYILPVAIWWLALTIAGAVFLVGPFRWVYVGILLSAGLFYVYTSRIASKGRFFPNLCLFAIFIYLVVSAFVLPTAAERRSGLTLPAKLTQYSDAHVGFYRTYSASSVFYGGPTTTKVVLPEEIVSSDDGANWNLKYVMPLETIRDFAEPHSGTRRNLLFIQTSKVDDFKKVLDPTVEIRFVETFHKFSIFEVRRNEKVSEND